MLALIFGMVVMAAAGWGTGSLIWRSHVPAALMLGAVAICAAVYVALRLVFW